MLFLAIGLAAGVLAGMFGIGGGIIIVPALIMLARFAPHVATGTSLAVFLMPVGALGAWMHWRQGNVQIGSAVLIALGVFSGSLLGAHISLTMPPLVLRRAFAVLLVLAAVRMWFGK